MNKQKRGGAFILGVAVVILAIVGAGTLISMASDTAGRFFGENARKVEFSQFLTPILAFDPDPFDDLSKASMTQLLDITIWNMLLHDDEMETGKFEEVTLGDGVGMKLPVAEVEASFIKLFGSSESFVHATIDGGTYVFTFDTNAQAYIVPITGVEPIYVSQVMDIDRRTRSVVLTVAYLRASGYTQDEQGNIIPPEPDKFRKITLYTTDGGYYIGAIQAM